MKALCLLLFLVSGSCTSLHAQSNTVYHLLIGTYTSGKSEGIYVYSFNSTTGEVAHEQTFKAITNPSYLAISPDRKFVYSVTTGTDLPGAVTALSFDKTSGQLTFLNRQSSGSQGPCYVSVDKTGKHVFVANYGGGSLGALPLTPMGLLDSPLQHIINTGSSINKERQDKPHVHAVVVSPDNQYLFSPDLGTDKVMTFKIQDQLADPLVPARSPFFQTEPGSGPRHLTFHPNGKYAYLIHEINGTISALSYKAGTLTQLQTITMLPDNFKGEVRAADIHVSPDGKFLYGSNRGDANDIVIYSIDAQNGKLKLVGHQSSLGLSPRNFMIDPTGKFLLVANEKSDNIFILKRNSETGLLTETGNKIEVGSPVCLVMTPKN